MRVINLLGGPGIGKTTLAAEIFSEMKKRHLNVELVTEYAKILVYEKRHNVLEDQLYIFAKQNRKLRRLVEYGVDYAVTDSPLILSLFYEIVHKEVPNKKFIDFGLEIVSAYENHNFFLERDASRVYQASGRLEATIEEAIKRDNMLLSFLESYNIPYQRTNPADIQKFLIF